MGEAHTTGVRQAVRRDIRRLAELWAHAFPGERTVEQRVRQLEEGGVFGGIDQAWYIERDGRVAGAFRAYALTQYLHGAATPMLGLAAVAVAADARRAGIGTQLCAAAVRIGRERGDLVSVLYPFRPDFYRRLGWGLVGSLHAYRFAPRQLPVTMARPAVRLAGAELLPGVYACYEDVARAGHGPIQRTAAIWRQHLAPGTRHVYACAEGDGVRGYALISYGRSRSPDRRPLVVHELVARDRAARAELYSWLSLQRDAWGTIRYDALPEERLDLLLEDPRPRGYRPQRVLWAPTARILRGPMLRVLDLKGLLEARPEWPAVPPFDLALQLRDELLPENEGPWHVAFDGRRVTCTRTDGRPDAVAATLTIDAAGFAQVFAGELRAGDAARLGMAEVSGDVDGLDALFHSERTLRLLDEF